MTGSDWNLGSALRNRCSRNTVPGGSLFEDPRCKTTVMSRVPFRARCSGYCRDQHAPAREEIGYHEVKAYGELLYRSRLDLRTTPADLATAVGCERWHTLPKIIRRLQEHGLADEQLKPLQDAKGVFPPKEERETPMAE